MATTHGRVLEAWYKVEKRNWFARMIFGGKKYRVRRYISMETRKGEYHGARVMPDPFFTPLHFNTYAYASAYVETLDQQTPKSLKSGESEKVDRDAAWRESDDSFRRASAESRDSNSGYSGYSSYSSDGGCSSSSSSSSSSCD